MLFSPQAGLPYGQAVRIPTGSRLRADVASQHQDHGVAAAPQAVGLASPQVDPGGSGGVGCRAHRNFPVWLR